MIEVLANNITQGVESAIGAGFAAGIFIFLFAWAIAIVFLVINTAIITWTVKKVWYAGSNKGPNNRHKSYSNLQFPTGWTFNENTNLWDPPKKR